MRRNELYTRLTRNANGSCSIWINNARFCPNIYCKIIKEFAVGKELYFGHYKKDGVNISNNLFKQYGIDIASFFTTYGLYNPIEEQYLKKGKTYTRQELTVCSAPNDEITYRMFEKIFHYYLETILFCPQIKWNTFVNSYSNYMNIVTNDYVLNGYTDFLFSYVDSGDFYITFNPSKYNIKVIENHISKIILESIN